MSPELRAIIERLEKVERQNRRLKRAAFTVLLLAGVVMVMGQAHLSRTIVAQKFVLTDTRGETRAVLTAAGIDPSLLLTPGEAMFALYDTNGRVGAVLTAGPEGSHLQLADANQRVSADLGVHVYGPALSLYDANGKERLSLNVHRDLSGAPEVSLSDSDRVRISLNLLDGPSVYLNDKQGYAAAVGNIDLVTPRTGETSKSSAASVVLFGKDMKVLWKAP